MEVFPQIHAATFATQQRVMKERFLELVFLGEGKVPNCEGALALFTLSEVVG